MDFEQQLKDSNAEKLALDQLYVESLKSSLNLRKQLILKETEIQELKTELGQVKKELQNMKDNKPKEILIDFEKDC